MRPALALCVAVLAVAGCKRHPAIDAGAPTLAPPTDEEKDATPIVTVSAGAAVVIPSEKPDAGPAPVDAGPVDAGEPDAGEADAGADAGPGPLWVTFDGGPNDAGVSDLVRLRVGDRVPIKFEGPIVGVICDDKFVDPVATGASIELVGMSPGTTHCVFKIFSSSLPGRYFEITVTP